MRSVDALSGLGSVLARDERLMIEYEYEYEYEHEYDAGEHSSQNSTVHKLNIGYCQFVFISYSTPTPTPLLLLSSSLSSSSSLFFSFFLFFSSSPTPHLLSFTPHLLLIYSSFTPHLLLPAGGAPPNTFSRSKGSWKPSEIRVMYRPRQSQMKMDMACRGPNAFSRSA